MLANALYAHRWNESVMTGAGAFAARLQNSRSENLEDYFLAGPLLAAAITKEFGGFVRSLENSHRLRITVNDGYPSEPDIYYEIYLRIKMPPNIALAGEFGISSYQMREIKGSGGLYLHAGF
jgi:hypothetical protein